MSSNWTETKVKIAENQSSRACVIFIHGFGGAVAKTWGDFPQYLKFAEDLDGYDVRCFGYATSLWPDLLSGIWTGKPDIPRVASAFAQYWQDEIRDRYDTFAIIAHSMGGLVSQRAILNRDDMRGHLSHLFMFGTPSGGLTSASLFSRVLAKVWPNDAVEDMAKGGPFITQLRADWTEKCGAIPDFQFCAIEGYGDEFVDREASVVPFDGDLWATIPGDHLSIVKPTKPDAPAVKLIVNGLLRRRADEKRRWQAKVKTDAAKLALEMVNTRDFINRYGESPGDLDQFTARDLALALDRKGDRDAAIAVLASYGRLGTDAKGVLAGRFKRAWYDTGKATDGQSALDLYLDAYSEAKSQNDPRQCYYHGINIAFLAFVFEKDRDKAKDWANKVLGHCGEAASGEEEKIDKVWRLASQAEAHLLLRDQEQSGTLYSDALGLQPEPWQIVSMASQAFKVADEIRDEQMKTILLDAFNGATE